MAYVQKLGSGSLFSNRDKKNDKAPNVKGTALVKVGNQIVELDIGGWTREGTKAGKWLSLSVKVKSMRQLGRPDDSDMDAAFQQAAASAFSSDAAFDQPPAADEDIPF